MGVLPSYAINLNKDIQNVTMKKLDGDSSHLCCKPNIKKIFTIYDVKLILPSV